MSKTLDRVSKLLNQAENAGTPEEAETFMAKAMEMAAINNIDLAVARMHQANKEKAEEVEHRTLRVNPYTRKHNRKHFIELAGAIARVNDVEYLIGGNDYHLICTGFPSDIDVVEALYTHLAVQMVTECDEALARGENREDQVVPKMRREPIPDDERDWGGWDDSQNRYYDEELWDGPYYNYNTGRMNTTPHQPPKTRQVPVLDDDGKPVLEEQNVLVTDGRIFRGNFYEAFVMRMRARLWEIRRAAERDRGEKPEEVEETALAIRDKKKEVDDAFNDRIGVQRVGVYKSASETNRRSDGSGRAHDAGYQAGDRVPIHEGREVKKN